MTIWEVKTTQDFVNFSKADPVLCNNIASDWEYLELEHGELEDNDEVFQWYIVSDNFAENIKRFTDKILFYHTKLEVYVWARTSYGIYWEDEPITLKNI